ncbi:MAG: hypothetical protein JF621_13255, partial [Streptomyces turgidiscabies]|nr:hypothetical protein [Streptomyces turgidiscabies]
MATLPAHRMSQAGQDWLLTCAVDAVTVRRTWDAGGLAEFPTGPYWRVTEAPLPRSSEAVGRVGGDRIGPVL